MKFIGEIFQTLSLSFTIQVQSKNAGKGDDQLVTAYKSKKGNMSLIFSPRIALVISAKDPAISENALIPQRLIYRFGSDVSRLYRDITTGNFYQVDGNRIFLDSNVAAKLTRRMSLFRNFLNLTPAIVNGPDNSQERGVSIFIDKTLIGTMSLRDMISLIDAIDHLDMLTYATMAGLIDELEAMNIKMDTIYNKTCSVEQMLQELLKQKGVQGGPRSGVQFDWTSMDSYPY